MMKLKNSERLVSVSKHIAAACFMLLALEEQSASPQTSPYQIHNHFSFSSILSLLHASDKPFFSLRR